MQLLETYIFNFGGKLNTTNLKQMKIRLQYEYNINSVY